MFASPDLATDLEATLSTNNYNYFIILICQIIAYLNKK